MTTVEPRAKGVRTTIGKSDMPIEIDPFHAISISRLAHQLRAGGGR